MINEDQLEKLALAWFQDNGYVYRNGKDIAPESDDPHRTSFKEVILEKELLEALPLLSFCIF